MKSNNKKTTDVFSMTGVSEDGNQFIYKDSKGSNREKKLDSSIFKIKRESFNRSGVSIADIIFNQFNSEDNV